MMMTMLWRRSNHLVVVVPFLSSLPFPLLLLPPLTKRNPSLLCQSLGTCSAPLQSSSKSELEPEKSAFSNADTCSRLRLAPLRVDDESESPSPREVLRSFDISETDCAALVGHCPLFFASANARNRLQAVLRVLEDSGFDKKKIGKMLVSFPPLVLCNPFYIEELLNFLEELLDEPRIFTRVGSDDFARIFGQTRETVDQTVEYLLSIGIAKRTIGQILISNPAHDLEEMKKCVHHLNSTGISEEAIPKLFEKNPRLFTHWTSEVKPKVDFMREEGFSEKWVERYVADRPRFLHYSLKENYVPKINFLLDLGFQKDSYKLKHALKFCLPRSIRHLKKRMEKLVEYGIEREEARKMVILQPEILGLSNQNLERRINYWVNKLRLPLHYLADHPNMLCLSSELNFEPRVDVISLIKQKRLLREIAPLPEILRLPTPAFYKKYVERFPEALSIYENSIKAVKSRHANRK